MASSPSTGNSHTRQGNAGDAGNASNTSCGDVGYRRPVRSRRPISDLRGSDAGVRRPRHQRHHRSDLPQPHREWREQHEQRFGYDASRGDHRQGRGYGFAYRAGSATQRSGNGSGKNWALLAGVMALGVVSLMVLISVFSGEDSEDTAASTLGTTSTADTTDTVGTADTAQSATTSSTLTAPVPDQKYEGLSDAELPPGGPVTERGSGNYIQVGTPGEQVGKGNERVFTYVIEVEDTINESQYGGNDAFSSTVDSILSNPKSWIGDSRYGFKNLGPGSKEKPDLRIQLSSSRTAAELCGDSYGAEVSCFYSDGDRVVINEARWVRGAVPFNGDLGSYRQYVINHEVGHGLGYASHVQCHADGSLAPIMMQQSLSLSNSELYKIDPEEVYANNDDTCRPNGWVFPLSVPEGQRQADTAASGNQDQ